MVKSGTLSSFKVTQETQWISKSRFIHILNELCTNLFSCIYIYDVPCMELKSLWLNGRLHRWKVAPFHNVISISINSVILWFFENTLKLKLNESLMELNTSQAFMFSLFLWLECMLKSLNLVWSIRLWRI